MTQREQDMERAIDAVLHALGDVEPLPGMEQRVIRAMEQAGEKPERGSGFAFPGLRWTLAGVGLAACGFVWFAHRSHEAAVPSISAGTVVVQRVSARESLPEKRETTTVAKVAAAHRHRAAEGDGRQASVGPIVEPPMTHEEWLMQRLAVRNDPEVIARLRAEERLAPMEVVIEINRDSAAVISDVP